MSREQFAARVGVGVSSVNNWLSGFAQIPQRRQALIAELMAAEKKQSEETKVAVAVLMTASQRARILEAARRCGQSIDDFISTAAQERADGILGTLSESESAS